MNFVKKHVSHYKWNTKLERYWNTIQWSTYFHLLKLMTFCQKSQPISNIKLHKLCMLASKIECLSLRTKIQCLFQHWFQNCSPYEWMLANSSTIRVSTLIKCTLLWMEEWIWSLEFIRSHSKHMSQVVILVRLKFSTIVLDFTLPELRLNVSCWPLSRTYLKKYCKPSPSTSRRSRILVLRNWSGRRMPSKNYRI